MEKAARQPQAVIGLGAWLGYLAAQEDSRGGNDQEPGSRLEIVSRKPLRKGRPALTHTTDRTILVPFLSVGPDRVIDMAGLRDPSKSIYQT